MRVLLITLLCVTSAPATFGFNADSEAGRLVRAAEESVERFEFAQAEQHLLAALAVSESGATRATILNNLAFVYHKRGKYAQAERCYLRAIEIWAGTPGHYEFSRLRSIGNLATHYVESRQFDKAERLGLGSLVEQFSGRKADSQTLASLFGSLGAVARAKGLYAQAAGHFLKALAIWNSLEPRGVAAVEVLNNLALVYEEAGNSDEARHYFDLAQRTAATALRPTDPRNAFLVANMGALEYRAHNLAEAELLFDRALSIAESSLGTDHPIVGRMLCNYAVVLRERKKRAKAREIEERGAEVLRKAAVGQVALHTVDISELEPRSAKKW